MKCNNKKTLYLKTNFLEFSLLYYILLKKFLIFITREKEELDVTIIKFNYQIIYKMYIII